MRPFNYYTNLYAEHESGEEGKGQSGGEGSDHSGKGGKEEGAPSKSPKYDDREVESAVSLYRALQDPDLAGDIVATLAKKVNVKVDSDDTKSDVKKKIEGAVTRRFKEKLGKDFGTFADMVGPLIDEAVEEILETRFKATREESHQDTWNKAVEEFTGTYTVTPEVEEVMRELIEDSPPNLSRKGFNAQRYLARMYKSACEEVGVEVEEARPSRKSGRSKTRQVEDELPDFVVKPAPKSGVSVDEAVELAMKGIRLKY